MAKYIYIGEKKSGEVRYTVAQRLSTQAFGHTGVPSENLGVPYEIQKIAPPTLLKHPLLLPHQEQNKVKY